MDRLLQDLRYGVRLLVRTPGVTAAALIALALGTGVNTALFSVVNTVLLQPLPFPDSDKLVQLWRTEPPSLQFGSASYRRYVEWRARNRVFEEMGAWAPAGLTLTGGEAPERLPGGRASAAFFRVIDAAPEMGRWFSDVDDRPGAPKVVVISRSLWQRRFAASSAVLGTGIMIDGQPHTVIGVAPASLNDVWRVDAWVPLAMTVDTATRGNFLQIVARLRGGVTLERARVGLADLAAEMSHAFPDDRYGFNALALHDVLTQGPREALWILLGTTVFVLLIACANVANLLLARAVTRQKEMAVRTALGAPQRRLLRQVLTETILLALIGGALGLLLATGLLRVFALIAPANFPRLTSIHLDATVFLFSSGIAMLCGVIAGVLPALHVARAEPSDALREGSTRGATPGRVRIASRVLVVGQVALAVVLVTAAALTVKSLQRLTRQDLGMATSKVLTFSVSLPADTLVPTTAERPRIAQFFQQFENRLRGLPGVTSVGAINLLPIAQTGTNGQVYVRDRQLKPDEAPRAEFRVVTPTYFETVGVQLVAGRRLDDRDNAGAPNVVVINETLARQLWPGRPPATVLRAFMGTGFDDGSTFREVVGVVHDVRSRRVDAPPDAETYVPLAQFPLPTMALTVRTAAAPEALVPQVRSALAELDPQLAVAAVRTFDDVLAGATRTPRMYSALTALFGLLAGVLAVVGIYSLMSYTVAQRVRELAIRAALGSSSRGLLVLVLREGFLLTTSGIVVGVAGAIAASRLLQVLLYEVSPTDQAVLATTAAGVAVAAMLGYLVPALRASRVQPAITLRAE